MRTLGTLALTALVLTLMAGPALAMSHVVASGETLSGLARAYSIDMDAIIRANPTLTDPDLIAAGEPLLIPVASGDEPTSGTEPTPGDTGDTSAPDASWSTAFLDTSAAENAAAREVTIALDAPLLNPEATTQSYTNMGLLGVDGDAPLLMAAATSLPTDTFSPPPPQAPPVVAQVRSDPRTSYNRLKSAATANGTPRDCYRTTVRTANANGASGDGMSWPTSRKYQGKNLLVGLTQAIDAGDLKPGMVIYMNLRPGTDPNSVNLGNLPHWMTYLGRDAGGVHRFADQYATDFALGELPSYYGPRKLDEILDPYRR